MSQTRLPLTIIILFAYGWRLHGLTEESLWRDEVDAVYFALRDLPATLTMFVSSAQNGALYFLSLRGWLQAVGASEFALRYPSVMAGVLSIPLLWKVGQKLLYTPFNDHDSDRRLNHFIPLAAAILLAANPYQLWYSQEGKMYTIIVALSLLASWLWLRGIETADQPISWRYWFGYLIVATISIYSHLLMILMPPIHVLWFLIVWPKAKRARQGFAFALAGLTLPYLPMLWWQWDMLVATEQRTLYAFTPFQDVLRVLLDNHIQGFMETKETLWYAPIYFVALAGLLMGAWELRSTLARTESSGENSLKHHDDDTNDSSRQGTKIIDRLEVQIPGWKRYLMLICWLFGPILLIHGLSLRQPVFVDRYIIWIGPAGILLLTLGLTVVWNNAASIAKPLVFCLLLYISGFWLYAGWEQKALDIKYDLRSAVGTVSAYREADELLILQIPHMEYSFRYYSSGQFDDSPFVGSTERLGHWIGGLWTNNGHPDDQARAEVSEQLEHITGNFSTVWVLRSEAESWDQRGLMEEWLDNHSEHVDYWDYHGSQVRRYQLDRPK